MAGANELLSQGWVLVKAVEKLGVDQKGNETTSIVYIVGRRKNSDGVPMSDANESKANKRGPKNPRAHGSNPSPSIDEEKLRASPTPTVPDILSLDIAWRQKRDMNPNFYYAFTRGLDGSRDPIVSSVVDAIKLSRTGSLEQNGWRFTVSKDGKFLQRSRNSQIKAVTPR